MQWFLQKRVLTKADTWLVLVMCAGAIWISPPRKLVASPFGIALVRGLGHNTRMLPKVYSAARLRGAQVCRGGSRPVSNTALFLCLACAGLLTLRASLEGAEPNPGRSPAEHLPSHITQVTWFGERADWSHDGKRILFLSKTFGDAMEIDLPTRRIRNLTAHYPHHGYTRALYLANGDILLSGPESFDTRKTGEARVQCWLYVLDRAGTQPAMPLGTKCSEGPAVSRKRLHIAWTHVAAEYLEEMPAGSSRMQEADIVLDEGKPKLANQKLIIDSRDLPFHCTMETQNFRPPEEKELTFSAYGYQGTEVAGIDLVTRKVTNYSQAPGQYDEPEGIYPDGQYTLVECDRQNLKGPGYVDLWKLRLDGSGEYERLTYFSDVPGYKASNPVVSDDGKLIAFQMATSREAAGVGHGIFVYDIDKAGKVK